MLQTRRDGVWDDLYAFTHEPQLPVDYEIANHYTSTHPSSRFTQRLTAQRLAADVRWTLRDRELVEDRGATIRTRDIGTTTNCRRCWRILSGSDFPAATRFVPPHDAS